MHPIRIDEGVVYGRGSGRALRCDVYTPPGGAAPAPAVLLIHGGGWRAGERGVMRGYGERLATAGFVCVAPEYRLTPEAAWPAQLQDIHAALRWVQAERARLGIDVGTIALLGRSAGAHLALLAAATADIPEFSDRHTSARADVAAPVAAVVAIFPPTVFFTGETRVHGGTPATALLGDSATEAGARAASPLAYVSPRFPPTFLLHGTADTVVPPSASMVLYEALVAARVPVELHLYAEQPHGFAGQPEFIDLCAAEAVHFLRRYIPAAPAAATPHGVGVP